MTDLSQLARELSRLASPAKVPIDQTLWSAEQVADYLVVTPEYFRDRIRGKAAGFPRPVNLRDDATCHRWFAGQVIEWAMARQ